MISFFMEKNEFDQHDHDHMHRFAEKLKNDSHIGGKPLSSGRSSKRLKINSITIRGERHSGTGFLRVIIGKNCPEMTFKIKCEDYRGRSAKNCNGNLFTKGHEIGLSNQTDPWLHNLNIDEKYDWKHSVLKQNTVLDPEDLMIVIFRNYSTWLPKMRDVTYVDVPGDRIPMHDFLRSEWKNPLSGSRTDHSQTDPAYYSGFKNFGSAPKFGHIWGLLSEIFWPKNKFFKIVFPACPMGSFYGEILT